MNFCLTCCDKPGDNPWKKSMTDTEARLHLDMHPDHKVKSINAETFDDFKPEKSCHKS
jgi:hypothetical protein